VYRSLLCFESHAPLATKHCLCSTVRIRFAYTCRFSGRVAIVHWQRTEGSTETGRVHRLASLHRMLVHAFYGTSPASHASCNGPFRGHFGTRRARGFDGRFALFVVQKLTVRIFKTGSLSRLDRSQPSWYGSALLVEWFRRGGTFE
jgi:hypothetical protein